MLYLREHNMERIILFAGDMSTSTTIHPMNVTRRSFYAVGQSCVINLNPTQSQSGDTPIQACLDSVELGHVIGTV